MFSKFLKLYHQSLPVKSKLPYHLPSRYNFANVTKKEYNQAKKYIQLKMPDIKKPQETFRPSFKEEEIKNQISYIMQYYSNFKDEIFKDQNKDTITESLEIRRLKEEKEIPVEDKILMMKMILDCTPEIEFRYGKLPFEYDLRSENNSKLINLFEYYNDSGRKVNPKLGGLYPVFLDGSYFGFFSLKESILSNNKLEMSLYLTESKRGAGWGERIFRNALEMCFLLNSNPPPILFTWREGNEKIEHIMKKYGLIVTKNGNPSTGFIDKESYEKAFSERIGVDPAQYVINNVLEKKVNNSLNDLSNQKVEKMEK